MDYLMVDAAVQAWLDMDDEAMEAEIEVNLED